MPFSGIKYVLSKPLNFNFSPINQVLEIHSGHWNIFQNFLIPWFFSVLRDIGKNCISLKRYRSLVFQHFLKISMNSHFLNHCTISCECFYSLWLLLSTCPCVLKLLKGRMLFQSFCFFQRKRKEDISRLSISMKFCFSSIQL